MFSYASYTPVLPPLLNILLEDFIPLGPGAAWVLRVLLVGWLLVEWWRLLRDGDERRLGWALAFTLVMTQLLSPHASIYQYVVFLFALLLVLQRLEAVHRLVMLGMMLALLIGDWSVFFATVDTELFDLLLFPLPLVTLLLLVLSRASTGRAAREQLTHAHQLKT